MFAHTSCQTDQVEISDDYLDNEELDPSNSDEKGSANYTKPVSSTLPRPSSSARIPETPTIENMVLLRTRTWKVMGPRSTLVISASLRPRKTLRNECIVLKGW
ncbi:unnamed protein product [Absidia cylindrospora]